MEYSTDLWLPHCICDVFGSQQTCNNDLMLETIGSQLICWLSTKQLSWTTFLSWKYRKNPMTTTWFKILEPTCNTSSIMLHFDWLISTPISAIAISRKGPWPAGKKAHSGRRVVLPPSCRICQIDSISNHNQLHLKVVSMRIYIYIHSQQESGKIFHVRCYVSKIWYILAPSYRILRNPFNINVYSFKFAVLQDSTRPAWSHRPVVSLGSLGGVAGAWAESIKTTFPSHKMLRCFNGFFWYLNAFQCIKYHSTAAVDTEHPTLISTAGHDWKRTFAGWEYFRKDSSIFSDDLNRKINVFKFVAAWISESSL